jgi:hypothetical protein
MIMTTHSNSTYFRPLYPTHDFPRNWSALDLADAVPLRLSERMSLGLIELGGPLPANGPFATPQPTARTWRRGYTAGAQLTSFRVR